MKKQRLSARPAASHWVELVLLVAFFAGTLILVNYMAYQNDRRFDLTPEKRFSLAPQTVSILENLSEDVYATVFYRQQEREALQDLVELFTRATPRFHYTFIDLEKNPAKAESFNIKSYGAGFVEYQGRREKVQYFSEENLLRSIIQLTENTVKVIRFVQGHGEKDISSGDSEKGYNTVRNALETENFRAENLLLMQAEKVPEDTHVLVIAGPQKDYFQKEIDMMDAYLQAGGRVLMLCDPFPLPAIEAYLKSRKIGLTRDFIIDSRSKLMGLDNLTPIIQPDKRHPIAKFMNDAIVFPVCRSVLPLDTLKVETLARSGPESWSEQDKQSVYDGNARFNRDQDREGPVPVGVVSRIPSEDQSGYLVVMGNSSFVANHYVNVLGNKDFFLNTVNWLTDKDRLLSTRSKAGSAPVSMLFLTENESRLVLWSSVLVEPGLVLLAGILVLLWRRFRR